jgi:Protein of unknown function (DUF2878)
MNKHQTLRNTVINSLMFNVSWLAIVLSQSDFWAPLLAATHLIIHFVLMGRGRVELQLIMAVSVFGLLLDQLLFRIGVFTLAGSNGFAPLWLSCLWPVLATTLMHAFSSLNTRLLLAVMVGAIGGAASYTAGTRLSGIAFGSPDYGPLIMASLWALLFPLLLRAAQYSATTKVAQYE